MVLQKKNSRCRVVALAGGGVARDKTQRRLSKIIAVAVVVECSCYLIIIIVQQCDLYQSSAPLVKHFAEGNCARN